MENQGVTGRHISRTHRHPASGRGRRRTYTLEKAVMPVSSGLFEKKKGAGKTARSVLTGRAVFVFCGLLFIGAGIYNVLF